jgi:rhomboid protease GluP
MTNHQRTSLLCPNCRTLVSVHETRCPQCGLAHPGAWWKNNALARGLRNADQLIRVLIVVNIGMYVISLLLDPLSSNFSFNPLTALSPSNRSLLLLGATGTVPIDGLHRWWSLVSANYLHGGLLHLAFNMLAVRQIAPFVAQEYGTSRLVILYTLSGIVGFGVSYLAGIRLTIGASAALCGLIGAALYYGKSRGGVYGQAIFRQVGGWAVAIFVFGFIVPGINNWGHGAGMAAGALLGFLLGYQERDREGLLHTILATVCVALTVLILGWAVITSVYYRVAG